MKPHPAGDSVLYGDSIVQPEPLLFSQIIMRGSIRATRTTSSPFTRKAGFGQNALHFTTYALSRYAQHDAISHTDVGFARSLTRIPVI